MSYAELHCHSYYSFHDGASSLEELMTRAKELGYHSLAVTDHDNLCGAMRFAQLAKSLEMHVITGAEITLKEAFTSPSSPKTAKAIKTSAASSPPPTIPVNAMTPPCPSNSCRNMPGD